MEHSNIRAGQDSRPGVRGNLGPVAFLAFVLAVAVGLSACMGSFTSSLGRNPPQNLTTAGPQIDISPSHSLVDQRLDIRLAGLEPNQPVTLEAEARDSLGRVWQSYAAFTSDNLGKVDLGTERPQSGTYNVVDSMGLFWSLHLSDPGGSGNLNFEDDETPKAMEVTITAKVDGKAVASEKVRREIAADGVSRAPLRQDGMAGILFRPPGPGSHPAVVVLAGAEGGLHADQAALLASHGLTSLALAYFGYDSLPPSLKDIPLEYFIEAIRWLQAQDGVRPDRVAVVGASRGGELALELGATFPEIKAVVAYVPSNYIGPSEDSTEPAWTFRGQAVPYVTDFDTIFSAARGDATAAQHARGALIPVEKINGPVLLVSAKDDRIWPSLLMSGDMIRRLAELHHPYLDKQLSYDGAGHLILQMVPYLPYTAQRDPPNVMRYINYYGGTASGDAFAEEDSWPQVISFLQEGLK